MKKGVVENILKFVDTIGEAFAGRYKRPNK